MDEETITLDEVIRVLLQVASVVALILFTYGLILLLFALPQDKEEKEEKMLEHQVDGPKLIKNKH